MVQNDLKYLYLYCRYNKIQLEFCFNSVFDSNFTESKLQFIYTRLITVLHG